MSIGTYGSLVFEVGGTEDRPTILTPRNLKTSASAKWAYHEPLGGKPWSEYLRPELRKASFEIMLSVQFGQRPRQALEELERMAEEGFADYLTIGGKPLTENKWKLLSVSDSWGQTFAGGELINATARLELEEYV